jgi:hypothetical protein
MKKLLSFRNKNLPSALLKEANELVKEESEFSFRCILKVIGERNSRYSQLDNLNHLAKMMMGVYYDKDTGCQHSIEEAVRSKQAKAQAKSYCSQYNSVQISSIEDSLLSKQVKDAAYLDSQYRLHLESPLNIMRDEIYLQLIKQLGGNNNTKQVDCIVETLELLTRYYAPSAAFVYPFMDFASKHAAVKKSLVRNNLARFADCYLKLGCLTDRVELLVDRLEYLAARKSELQAYELEGKLSLNIQVYGRLVIVQTFTNETLRIIKMEAIRQLGLSELADSYSLWHSLRDSDRDQPVDGYFVREDMKVVDYLANSLREVQEQLAFNKRCCTFQLRVRIKFFFPYRPSQPRLVNLLHMQIEEDFKELKFGLPEKTEIELTALSLYLQRGPYKKEKFRKEWLSAYWWATNELSQRVEDCYRQLSPVARRLDLQMEFLEAIAKTNQHLFCAHEFNVTYFEVEQAEDGSYKRSATGINVLMVVKPTYLVLADLDRPGSST